MAQSQNNDDDTTSTNTAEAGSTRSSLEPDSKITAGAERYLSLAKTAASEEGPTAVYVDLSSLLEIHPLTPSSMASLPPSLPIFLDEFV